MTTLQGKVALVTGASRGIGAAIAKRLARDGAAVAITYSSSATKAEEVSQAIRADGGKSVAIKADSASVEDVRGAIAETIKALGGLDIVVNNAGLALTGPTEEFSMEDFDRMLNVNVRGVYIVIKEALPHLKAGARIINIGSCVAERMPFPGAGPYTMTKAAVAGLTQGLARELGSKGITINNVQPGPTNTEMNPADGPDAEMMRNLTALGRHGEPEEIASMVAFLSGPEAAYITGTAMTVDGGYAA